MGILNRSIFKNQLSSRERFQRVMHYQYVDRIPNFEFSYWSELYEVWRKQGVDMLIPGKYKENEKILYNYFEIEGSMDNNVIPFNIWDYLRPPFERKVIETGERHVIEMNEDGALVKKFSDGTMQTIPQYIEFGLKNRDDWKRYKERLDPLDPSRYPADWAHLMEMADKSDKPVGIYIGSLLGIIRDWMGFEGLCYAFYDDPHWVEEMIEYMCQFQITILESALKRIKFDFAQGWEDIAFKNGPMISPAMFKEMLFPRYKRISDFLRLHGIDVITTDCDGNINPIVDQWIEAGYTCQFPIEVGEGECTDPVVLRKRFGKQVLMMGGVDKRKLIQGKYAIDQELDRIAGAVEEGGFIPHIDHRCPPDVSFENYSYYMKRKKTLLGF